MSDAHRDLVDRMRTCAAFVLSHDSGTGGQSSLMAHVTLDAADLLIEASNALEVRQPAVPAPLSTPMDVIAPQPVEPVDQMRARHPALNACPRCDSRAAKRVRRSGRALMLTCPACAIEWEYKPQGLWT